MKFDAATQQNLDLWLNGPYDEETKCAIRDLIREHPSEAADAFYTTLSFGTGGLRGIMGVGCNRINIYTVRTVTQGLAQYILKNGEKGKNGVLIGYDSRHRSQEFALEAANVLAANQIKVFLCSELTPVPFVSFGCRHLQCQAAIVITASHNPATYNGYKVYWSDGGQVVAPHDTGIIAEIKAVTEVKRIDNPLIEYVKKEVDEAYLQAISTLQHYPEENQKFGNELKITYTSLHGTGIALAPKAFAKWGFHHLNFVEQQIIPDGDFPTVSFPNPEEDSALQLGIETMIREESDLLLATDPDADRVGVVIMHEGKPVRLNGNQIACLCLEHVCHALITKGQLPKKAACIKTIVTSELFQAIADAHHIPCFNVLPGFKYIAETIHLWEIEGGCQFIFGGEESYGYLLGTYTRDKDAILSCALIAEIALHAKRMGKTLLDLIRELYAKYGNYTEVLYAHTFPETKEGKEIIAKGMEKLRNFPPAHLLKITAIDDYQRSIQTDLNSGKTKTIKLPKSYVLTFWLEDGSKLIVRPSGSEPKIKFYCGVSSKTDSLEACRARAGRHIDAIKNFVLAL
jgi:phosphomannomutase